MGTTAGRTIIPLATRVRHSAQDSGTTLREEILAGLRATPSVIAPKYFYDALGSRLFEAITELPEYYPTRTENAILETHAGEIARVAGTDRTLIDLGAGNCEKAARLFGALRPAQYAALDVSLEFLEAAVARLRPRHPSIRMLAVGTDFSARLQLPPEVASARRLFFYPGSSIGNFTPDQAVGLLAQMRALCDADGGLLIGIDLVKPTDVLEAAYDDALGVTAAFNLNVLRRANALAGTDFDPLDWRHVALYATTESRIEMHLEARRALVVRWDGGERRYAAGERILTEYSYKYRLDTFEALLARAGFQGMRAWTDARGWFAVCHARAGA